MMLESGRGTIEFEKTIQDKCGLVALYAPDYGEQLSFALLAAGGVQHRGQQMAGMVLQAEAGPVRFAGAGLLKEVFTPEIISQYNRPALWTMIHCRYGTHGGYETFNSQPLLEVSKQGQLFAVAHNGEFIVTDELKSYAAKEHEGKVSDTYLFTQLLAQASGNSWEEKVINTLGQVKGAFSLVIGVEDKLFVARDDFGLRPLVVGRFGEGWVVASETHALDKVGATPERIVGNGEIIRIDRQGLVVLRRPNQTAANFCDFEWAYFGRPDSLWPIDQAGDKANHPETWLSFARFRERCGEIMAQEAPLPTATFVAGVPDSGIAVATGYAAGSRLPYRQVIIRDHFDPNGEQRLFMRDDQMEKIGARVLGKLSLVADPEIWQDASVVIADDSIVRGNVSAQITRAIFAAGAREVHWVIGFPPISHPCHLGVSMRTGRELIAHQMRVNHQLVAEAIGATTVHYISPTGFLQARLLHGPMVPDDPQEIFLHNGGCGGCVTGRYPISQEGVVYEGK